MKKTETGNAQSTSTSMGSVPMGTIVAFALSAGNIPAGWLLCDGSAIPAQYSELITALGSSNTPNLAGRSLTGTGTPSNSAQADGTTPNFNSGANWTLGYTGGEYQSTLALNQIPSHQHYGWGEGGGGNWGGNTGTTINKGYSGSGKTDTDNYLFGSSFTGGNPGGLLQTQNGTVSGTTAGATTAHNNMPPYYTVNYIIYTGQ